MQHPLGQRGEAQTEAELEVLAEFGADVAAVHVELGLKGARENTLHYPIFRGLLCHHATVDA